MGNIGMGKVWALSNSSLRDDLVRRYSRGYVLVYDTAFVLFFFFFLARSATYGGETEMSSRTDRCKCKVIHKSPLILFITVRSTSTHSPVGPLN